MEMLLHRESQRSARCLALFHRHAENPILTARNWPYPAHTVFNAAACQVHDETVLLVRVEDRRGHSHLTVARSKDGISNWQIDAKPSFAADLANHAEEAWGIEDPRVTWVEDRGHWVIAYTAYSPSGPLVSLAETKDFISFNRIGAVMPPENKDAAVFPRRFCKSLCDDPSAGRQRQGRCQHVDLLLAQHGPLGRAPGSYARRHGAWWDAGKIGLGPPPLETAEGWLVLYHGVRVTAGGCLYRLGLALLDLDDPGRVIRRSDEWVFAPELPLRASGQRQRRGVSLRLDSPQSQRRGSVSITEERTPAWPWRRRRFLISSITYFRACPALKRIVAGKNAI